MDPLMLSGIMAGAGLLKGELIDKPKEAQDVWLAAQMQRYSPWTKINTDPMSYIRRADGPISSALQGGLQGYAMGQNIQEAEAERELAKLYAKAKGGNKPDEGIKPIKPKTDMGFVWDFL